MWCLIGIIWLWCLPLQDVLAQSMTAPTDNSCTNDPSFNPENSPTGLVTEIANQVQRLLNTLAQDLFVAISGHPNFQYAMAGLLTLYVAIFGILFAFGMVKETVYDFTIRVVKLAIIVILMNGSAWTYFYDHVVMLFVTATDELINTVTSVIVGASGAPDPGVPLSVLDTALQRALSSKMIVHLFAIATTGMYGIVHAVLMGFALFSFIGSLLLAVWIYLMSLVLRTLLFGLAPIFLACMLFDRTKPLFLGWLNQLVSVCLQPVLLFTFLSFFILLIVGTIDNLLTAPVCWTEIADSKRATPFQYIFPRFAIPDSSGSGGWLKFFGDWTWQGADSPLINSSTPSPIFPVDILGILTFLLLTQLGKRFSEISLLVAKDLAFGSVNLLHMKGGLQDFMTPGEKISSQANVGERLGPAGRTSAVTERERSAANRAANEIMGEIKRAGNSLVDRLSDLTNRRR